MDENTKKMLSGQPYCPDTAELHQFSQMAHRLCRDYTLTTMTILLNVRPWSIVSFPTMVMGSTFKGPFLLTTVASRPSGKTSTLTQT